MTKNIAVEPVIEPASFQDILQKQLLLSAVIIKAVPYIKGLTLLPDPSNQTIISSTNYGYALMMLSPYLLCTANVAYSAPDKVIIELPYRMRLFT